MLPMPGSSSWAVFAARLDTMLKHQDTRVLVAFWLLGLINNVLYVIILSAAQDLVGSLPKGIVLLADTVPSFFFKLVAPYFIHRIPYAVRVPILMAVSAAGMLLVALTPPTDSVAVKMFGVVLASSSSGLGELSFLGLTHYYGRLSLAGWGSGTGAAGMVGAGLYVVLTEWWGFSVKNSLLCAACLPVFMFVSFFGILPLGPLKNAGKKEDYHAVPQADGGEDEDDGTRSVASSQLLETGHGSTHGLTRDPDSLASHLRRAKALFLPYMVPLFLVYLAEYTINQGVSPTLLFSLSSSPFGEYREFYPFYSLLYQIGVFVSRTSIAFFRIRHLYAPSLLQVCNLVLLTLHSLFFFIPSVWVIFLVILWEGLLGGAVYVNAFAEILENVPAEDREFSLSAASVSDSAGICIAAFVSIGLEMGLCEYQVGHGRDWCRKIGTFRG